jgi:hypothetical protein
MKAEHTPGPWAVDFAADAKHMAACLNEGIGTDREWVAVESDGGHVAYCHPLNASLIAAAPKMLSALLEVQNWASMDSRLEAIVFRAIEASDSGEIA